MSSSVFFKCLMVLILSGFLGWVIFTRYDDEIGTDGGSTKRQRYLPYLNSAALPALPLSLFCVVSILYSFREAFNTVLPICFSIFLHISIYYAVLLPLIGLLRNYINARVCALLWLLPNYTYISYINSIMSSNKPQFILHIPGNIMMILLWVWLIGFCFVLTRAIIQHLLYRHSILKDSTPVTDPEILEIWNAELVKARIKKPKYELIMSVKTATPLSIGFSRKTIRVVLPNRHYTKDELTLILRHEIIHICRNDSGNKFSMIFCCAMCWFNPLMWLAMRKSADDLELSCDETVLIDADESARKQYANLILNTAADERGFTTCLSASPSALRYRLGGIIQKKQKTSGCIIAAIFCFILFMSNGTVAISCGNYSGRELIFEKQKIEDLSECHIVGISTSLLDHNGLVDCYDEEALKQYLLDLPLSRVTGTYKRETFKNELFLDCNGPSSSFYIHIKDQMMEIGPFGEPLNPFVFYQVTTKIDWDYLTSLIQPMYIQDTSLGFPPELQINSDSTTFYYLSGIARKQIKRGEHIEDDVYFGTKSIIGLQKTNSNTVTFRFSHKPSVPFHIEVRNNDGDTINTFEYTQLQENYILPVYSENAQYQCFVTFEDERLLLEMEYPFEMRYSMD